LPISCITVYSFCTLSKKALTSWVFIPIVQIAVWRDWLDLQGWIQQDNHYLFLSPIYRGGALKTREDILPFLKTVLCHPDFQLSVSKPSPYYTELSGRNNDTSAPVQPHHLH
jgi:hypothetical protein